MQLDLMVKELLMFFLPVNLSSLAIFYWGNELSMWNQNIAWHLFKLKTLHTNVFYNCMAFLKKKVKGYSSSSKLKSWPMIVNHLLHISGRSIIHTIINVFIASMTNDRNGHKNGIFFDFVHQILKQNA